MGGMFSKTSKNCWVHFRDGRNFFSGYIKLINAKEYGQNFGIYLLYHVFVYSVETEGVGFCFSSFEGLKGVQISFHFFAKKTPPPRLVGTYSNKRSVPYSGVIH